MNVDVDITKVDGAKFVETYCLGIINSANELRRILLHRPEEKTWQDAVEKRDSNGHCPFKYKGVECGATAAQTTCPKTLAACESRNNLARFGGEPPTADKDIMPRKAWNEARINDLRTAIRCALDACREIPAEWVEELNDLLAEVE